MDYPTTHASLSPIRRGFAPGFVNYKKGCTRLAAASDQVYQLLAHGLWFSLGTAASSTTKTGRHDIAEILLKVALKNQKIKSIILKGKTKSAINKEPHWIWIMEILTKTYKKSSFIKIQLSPNYYSSNI